ncbi:MAG: MotA/TolQ/ExbB proton channel family protein [Planctomycetota bacterium]
MPKSISENNGSKRYVSRRRVRLEKKQRVADKVAARNFSRADLQLEYDPIWEWLAYFAAMTALAAFATGQYMVSAVLNDKSCLCIVIYCLFLLGVFVNFRSILRLRREYTCAAVCMLNLRRSGFSEVTTNRAAGVLHQHIQDLSKMSKSDTDFSQDRLIMLLYSRMMSHARIVDVLSGILVTLGLVGTIVGLISMTDGLAGTLASLGEDGQASTLLAGMRTTMSGLGTAFNTTLVGAVLGSVFLRVLNSLYGANVDRLVAYVASTAEINVVPQLKLLARRRGSGA